MNLGIQMRDYRDAESRMFIFDCSNSTGAIESEIDMCLLISSES